MAIGDSPPRPGHPHGEKGAVNSAQLLANARVDASTLLTPEMLPMIVTVNLSKGALAMARKKAIVKRLNSIQNFGAMNVLCTDKTGEAEPSGYR